jgi:hypothetical protein
VAQPAGSGLVAVARSGVVVEAPASAGRLPTLTPPAVPIRHPRTTAHPGQTHAHKPVDRAPRAVALTLAQVRGLLSHLPVAATLPIAVANHDGRLLLLSGLALGMLVIASAALLRLLARVHGEW